MCASEPSHFDEGQSGRQLPDPDEFHQALFYEGDQEYLDGVAGFVGPALAAGEPVAAAVPPERGQLLRRHLNGSASSVEILDMFELGRNPARIIPAVEALLAAQGDARLPGQGDARLHYIGEPIWPGRSQEEIHETTKHEALINLAWPEAPIRVLCAYDATELGADILADAERTHPYVIRHGAGAHSDAYTGATLPHGCDRPLSDPPPDARSMAFGVGDLFRLRAMVGEVAQVAGLDTERSADLLLVTSELSSNAIRHGDGTGTLHAWSRRGTVICQVQGQGQISDPLAGLRRPMPSTAGGLGLWMVNQLCDLVELRTGPHGTTVRAHLARGAASRTGTMAKA